MKLFVVAAGAAIIAAGWGLARLFSKPPFPEVRVPEVIRDERTSGRTGFTGRSAVWKPELAAVDTYGPRAPDRWNASTGVFEYDMPNGHGSYLPTVAPELRGVPFADGLHIDATTDSAPAVVPFERA